jgi:GNAT superfamily N-acetyltransferase
MPLFLELTEQPADAVLRAIERGLAEHAAAAGVARDRRRLVVILRDGPDGLLGGLVGATVWGWLLVTELWVAAAHRQRGHGRRLLLAAEDEARRRGCHHALLDTFDFQAPAFYARLGYERFAALDDFPCGHTRLFLAKALLGTAATA